jgi:hypothetical protein
MLVGKANAAIENCGGIRTIEVVVWRRARLAINQNNNTLCSSVSSTRQHEMLFLVVKWYRSRSRSVFSNSKC